MYTFVMIGILHVAVVRVERVIGAHIWPGFVVLGAVCGATSLMTVDVLVSALLGVSGFPLRVVWPRVEKAEGKGLWGPLTGIYPFSLKPKIEIP